MNITHIQEKLNAIFQEPSRHCKLVLWYDSKGDFADDVQSLELASAELVYLNGHNNVSSKYRILCEEKDKNFLIYAPFPKPALDDETNHFLDVSFTLHPFMLMQCMICVRLTAFPVTFEALSKKGAVSGIAKAM